MKKFKSEFSNIKIDQTSPYPAWIHLYINDQRFSFYPEEFIQIVDFLNSFCKYELKDSENKEILYE